MTNPLRTPDGEYTAQVARQFPDVKAWSEPKGKASMIIGIDPGCSQSAWVALENGAPLLHDKQPNEAILARLRELWDPADDVAIEMIASYGMPVGKEVFETCLWIGRFMEAWHVRGGSVRLVYRREVKLFHCETSRANDANIRAALLDRYGPGREKAVGVKRAPGPLFGIKADEWSALAVALTAEHQTRATATTQRRDAEIDARVPLV